MQLKLILAITCGFDSNRLSGHNNIMFLTNVGCNGLESNLTSGCCATKDSHGICHSGNYAGVRCKHNYSTLLFLRENLLL